MYEFLEKYLPRDKRVRMGILMAADVFALCLASFLGLFVRFDLNISRVPPEYARAALEFLPYYILASLVIFFLARMYSTMWSVAGVREALHVVAACGLASLCNCHLRFACIQWCYYYHHQERKEWTSSQRKL